VDTLAVPDLISHLESHLGEITGGSLGDDETPPGVQVVWFTPGSPFDGASTIATLGLSNHHLTQVSGRGLHQELLMHFRSGSLPGNASGVLVQVAAELIERGRGLARGEVLGPRGRLFEVGTTTALYAAAPVYLPDSFHVYANGDREVVLTWLVPVTGEEAEYVRTHGWNAFETALVDEDPDLTDISREALAIARLHGEAT
jgi:hypothetical protein